MGVYQRFLTVSAHLIVEAMLRGETFFKTERGQVSIASTRLKTYMKGIVCVECGREGQYFALERHTGCLRDNAHFNLYHKKRPGASEILMTSDHIIAKVNGGSNELENRQPMCCICNSIKSNHSSVEEGRRVSQVARELNRPKKLIKLESSITYCIEMIEKNNISKNWSRILSLKVKEYMRQERMINELTNIETNFGGSRKR